MDKNHEHHCNEHHHDHYYFYGDTGSGGFGESDGKILGWILLIFGIAMILVK